MPIYEYRCPDCGKEFEKLIKPSKFPVSGPVVCIACGSKHLERKISVPNFSLKGTGWAKDGYGGK